MKSGVIQILDANPQPTVTKSIFSGLFLLPNHSKGLGDRLAHILR